MKKFFRFIFITIVLSIFVACTTTIRFSSDAEYGKFNKEKNVSTGKVFNGKASYYATKFHGKRTSSGEIFDMYKKTAAHKTLPFGTKLKVTNLNNRKTTIVKVNDRGPFKPGRSLDLSYGAAIELDMLNDGVIKYKAEILK